MRSHVTAGTQPGSVAIGDFNSDGKLDSAVTESKFRLAMRGRLSATRSDSALPIAKVSHSFRVSFGRRGKRHSGRVGYTRVVQKRIWRKLIRIEVNKDRSTNLCTVRFGSVLCLSKRPSCR